MKAKTIIPALILLIILSACQDDREHTRIPPFFYLEFERGLKTA